MVEFLRITFIWMLGWWVSTPIASLIITKFVKAEDFVSPIVGAIVWTGLVLGSYLIFIIFRF